MGSRQKSHFQLMEREGRARSREDNCIHQLIEREVRLETFLVKK